MNSLDAFVLAPRRGKACKPNERLKNSLEEVILSLSDQQAVAGPALLVAAFSQLSCTDGITSYYWRIMVFIVWFSSVTHLASLSVLSEYFKKRNQKARFLRVFLMFSTMSLLIGALYPTLKAKFYYYPISSPKCLYQDTRLSSYAGDDNTSFRANGILSILLLVTTYLVRVLDLYGFEQWIDKIHTACSRRLKKWLTSINKGRIYWRILGDFLLIQLAGIRAALYVIRSFMARVGGELLLSCTIN